eukprot:scaffold1590_cov417-Prasinococcus_capsulatus_cf.AAC.18
MQSPVLGEYAPTWITVTLRLSRSRPAHARTRDTSVRGLTVASLRALFTSFRPTCRPTDLGCPVGPSQGQLCPQRTVLLQ